MQALLVLLQVVQDKRVAAGALQDVDSSNLGYIYNYNYIYN